MTLEEQEQEKKLPLRQRLEARIAARRQEEQRQALRQQAPNVTPEQQMTPEEQKQQEEPRNSVEDLRRQETLCRQNYQDTEEHQFKALWSGKPIIQAHRHQLQLRPAQIKLLSAMLYYNAHAILRGKTKVHQGMATRIVQFIDKVPDPILELVADEITDQYPQKLQSDDTTSLWLNLTEVARCVAAMQMLDKMNQLLTTRRMRRQKRPPKPGDRRALL